MLFTYYYNLPTSARTDLATAVREIRSRFIIIYISVRYYRYHYRRGDRVNSAAADSSYARNRQAGASRRRSRSKTLAVATRLYLYLYQYNNIQCPVGSILLCCIVYPISTQSSDFRESKSVDEKKNAEILCRTTLQKLYRYISIIL